MDKKFVHRDLSWLSFNERVLQEAEATNVPLFERLKFLAIFSSNLDEFYRVRVSQLRQFKKFQNDSGLKLYEKPKALIKTIQKRVEAHQERFGAIYAKDIIPRLEQEQIYIVEGNGFNQSQKQFSQEYYKTEIKQHVRVYNLQEDLNVFLENKGLFLFVHQDEDYVINIPSNILPRFIVLPSESGILHVTYLDEIIKQNLGYIIPKLANAKSYAIKITRDAEMYFDEYDGELIELIKTHVELRDKGLATRLLYDKNMPKTHLKTLRKCLGLNKTDLMPGGKYHNFSDFFNFPFPKEKQHLFYPDATPMVRPELESETSLLEYLTHHDVLLAFPYQDFKYLPQVILEASKSKAIHSVNISLYRISKTSKIAKALLECLKQRKKVTVFIEAKARFDEENNMNWGEILEAHGAKVLYSMPNIKVHSKIFLLEGDMFSVGYVGTGNFNEKSATVYADFGLLTAKNNIVSDLKQVFMYLQAPDTFVPKVEAIWMSPFTTRTSIYTKIDREIAHAKAGRNASIMFKMNSLQDDAIIEKLYEASRAGVIVKLIVRGIFRLVPQQKGFSETINAVSVVGRYLEHARVYQFHNDGNEELYIASADCMTRNLDRRVEVAAPILDHDLKRIVKQCIELQWHDNTKARVLDKNQINAYQKNQLNPIDSQMDFYRFLKDLKKAK